MRGTWRGKRSHDVHYFAGSRGRMTLCGLEPHRSRGDCRELEPLVKTCHVFGTRCTDTVVRASWSMSSRCPWRKTSALSQGMRGSMRLPQAKTSTEHAPHAPTHPSLVDKPTISSASNVALSCHKSDVPPCRRRHLLQQSTDSLSQNR